MEDAKFYELLREISERLAKIETYNVEKFNVLENMLKSQEGDIRSMEKDIKEVQSKLEEKIKNIEKRVEENEKFKFKLLTFMSIVIGLVVFSGQVYKLLEGLFK